MTITEELLGKDRSGARFVLAAVAMHSIAGTLTAFGHYGRPPHPSADEIARRAFDQADAMLLELERREAEGR